MSTAETSEEDPDRPALAPDGPERAPPARAAPPPPEDSHADQLFTRPFVGLLGMQAAYGFSYSMFFLLPKYLAASGETPSRIGFVMGGFGVACVLTIPFLPAIIRALGRRGALMAANLLLSSAAVAFALIDRPGLMAVPLRASEGVTWTIMFSTALALTAEMAPRHRLAQAIGLAGAASLVMNAVAPAIGEPLADRFGYRWAFLLAAVSGLFAAALARRLPIARHAVLERRAPREADLESARVVDGTTITSRRQRFYRSSGLIPLYLVFGLAGLAFGVLFTFLAPFALSHGVRAIRPFFVAYTAAALAVRVLGGRLSDRLGHRAIAARALALYGLVVAAAGLLGPHHLAALGLAFGLAHGAAFPALMALLIAETPARRRPRVLGIANGAMSVGISAVFPAGLLVARLGYAAVFALVGCLAAASSALIRAPNGRSR
jgi:MFS family permease